MKLLKPLFLLTILLFFSFAGCKKEKADTATLTGTWELNYLMLTLYDNAGNKTSHDTVPLTDELGNEIDLIELYTVDGRFYSFADTTSDTLYIGTYKQEGTYLLLTTNDSSHIWNKRKINMLGAEQVVFQIDTVLDGINQSITLDFRRRN